MFGFRLLRSREYSGMVYANASEKQLKVSLAMSNVIGCITANYNIWLVIAAIFVCISGSWNLVRLFYRASSTTGVQRISWHFLTALTAASSIWCTHFIAMLAYDPGVPVNFDPVMTVVSLLVAMFGAQTGLIIAASGITPTAPTVGGCVLGLAIAAMHYTGMMAYRAEGIVTWNTLNLAGSLLLAVGFSSPALHFAMRRISRGDKYWATGLLGIAIISLHFTGMTAFQIAPMLGNDESYDPSSWQTLGLAVTVVAFVIAGAGIASYLIDSSSRTQALDRLRHMALNDGLTGLPNRVSFNERLDHEIRLCAESGGRIALLGIDLDHFKEINDLRGHAVGDEVLVTLAQRMTKLVQGSEFVARLGGDEFAAICRIGDDADLLDFLSRLENALFAPILRSDCEICPGASIGVAIFPDDAPDKGTLISNADLAMYRAKTEITQAICFYEPSMGETARARRDLINELRIALERNHLDIHYQVQMSIATGEVRGFEALLRWEHPTRGFIPPSEFIPLAEENGLILQLGEWVLRTACTKAAAWEPPYKVAVNLSAVQFAHSDLPQLIREILTETGLSPERLELELTESTIFADRAHALDTLDRIKSLGVCIALDDFGTGYSSLDTLRAFTFDKIKLDRSFMSEIESSPQAKAIIRAVLALGKSLDICVLAEGIETQGQLTILNMEGCDEVQGYLLGRPVPLQQIIESGQITLVAPLRPKDVATIALHESERTVQPSRFNRWQGRLA
jgi:diguanylate cyclase (GGDEF)-like protein